LGGLFGVLKRLLQIAELSMSQAEQKMELNIFGVDFQRPLVFTHGLLVLAILNPLITLQDERFDI